MIYFIWLLIRVSGLLCLAADVTAYMTLAQMPRYAKRVTEDQLWVL